MFTLNHFYLICGANLIVYDHLCGIIVQNTFTNPEIPLLSYATILSLRNSQNVIKRYIGVRAALSLVICTTPMKSAGRATMLVGVFSGTSWLLNAHFDRKALDQRASDNRAAANQREADERMRQNMCDEKNRAYENYKHARDVYYNTYRVLLKTPEPK